MRPTPWLLQTGLRHSRHRISGNPVDCLAAISLSPVSCVMTSKAKARPGYARVFRGDRGAAGTGSDGEKDVANRETMARFVRSNLVDQNKSRNFAEE
jgi:hypothetical protein